MPRRTTLVALLAAVLTTAALTVAASPSLASSQTARVVKPTIVTVKASEFKFVLSKRILAKPGVVVFKVTNTGKEAHNFVILSGVNKATALIQPRRTATLKVVFKKKGAYTYECTVGEHAEEGMLGRFIVK